MAPYQMSRDERKGMLLLIGAICLVILIWQLIPVIFPKQENSEIAKVQEQWQDFQDQNIKWDEANHNEGATSGFVNKYDDDALKKIAFQPKPFDPNNASIETMIASGIPIASAKRIIAYRNKNGVFYNKEKIRNFGLTDQEFNKVAPYISIAPRPSKYDNSSYSSEYKNNEYTPKVEPTNLDINTATVEDLKKFRGIGEGYANRIIKNRDRLGGYVNKQQIAETYGLPDSVFRHIEPKIIIDLNTIKKINVNTATEEELAAHPAIGKYMAKNIILLRNDIRKFEKINDLRQVPMINEEKFRKIVPYKKNTLKQAIYFYEFHTNRRAKAYWRNG